MSQPEIVQAATWETHEVTVNRYRDGSCFVGVDCIDGDGFYVRGTVISHHDDVADAIRHAERLAEILTWRQGRIPVWKTPTTTR